MTASTRPRWKALGRGEFQSRCPWCGELIEFYPRYREFYCAGTPGRPCGHNATVPRDECDCAKCLVVEDEEK
jgi:hypothetical protein